MRNILNQTIIQNSPCSRLGLAEAWGHLQSIRFNQDMTGFICAFQVCIRSPLFCIS